MEAQHAELMSFAALPRHLASQRDSLLSLQNVESLTDELAQLSQDLERLTTSEAASISDSPVGTLIIAFLFIRDTQLGRSLLCVRVACSSCSKHSYGQGVLSQAWTQAEWHCRSHSYFSML